MLILTRRAGEAILMDGDVRIVVLGVDSSGVRLGIEAPASIGILREEVVQRIAEENVRAGSTEGAREVLKRLTEARAPQQSSSKEGPTEGDEETGEGEATG